MTFALPLFVYVFWLGSTSGMSVCMSLGMSPLSSTLIGALTAVLSVLLIGGV